MLGQLMTAVLTGDKYQMADEATGRHKESKQWQFVENTVLDQDDQYSKSSYNPTQNQITHFSWTDSDGQ